jgi:hypothetical protein
MWPSISFDYGWMVMAAQWFGEEEWVVNNNKSEIRSTKSETNPKREKETRKQMQNQASPSRRCRFFLLFGIFRFGF